MALAVKFKGEKRQFLVIFVIFQREQEIFKADQPQDIIKAFFFFFNNQSNCPSDWRRKNKCLIAPDKEN